MAYPEIIKYLESFINYEKIPSFPYKESLKLERVGEFLASIGNPQDTLRCIHIAGTKGKGSTCAFLTYILREAGYKVGLYTSPHLSDFKERIRILWHRVSSSSSTRCPIGFTPGVRLASHPVQGEFEGMISQDELTGLVERLRPSIQRYNKNSKYGPLSFFEVYTALAFIYFKEKKVDFAVLETGLGGRLDATNVVNPLICAITSISYEHTQKLGNTLREIATEKAGIIKNQNLIVISAPQEKEAIEVIRSKCKDMGARLYEVNPVRNTKAIKRENKISHGVNKDIFYEETPKGFSVMGAFGEYPNLEIRLLGVHQIINATVAVGVIEALRFHNIHIGIDSIREGLYNTIWPGRCEVISKRPFIVLDGCQNIASSRALKETIKENFKYKKSILVLGVSSDKDIKGICNELNDVADTVILTKANNLRATPPKILADYFKAKVVHLTDNVKEAKVRALRMANKEDLILVCGSLFVMGEFRDGKI